MKKFLTMLLALAIVFTMAIPALAAPKNYAKDAKWVKAPVACAFGISSVTESNGVTTVTGFPDEWSSPVVDVLPAIKAALGNKDEVTITISFELRATFFAGSKGSSGTARLLFRGENGIYGFSDADDWNKTYCETLDGEAPFFNNDGGNIMRHTGTMVEIKDSDWSLVTTTLTLYAPHINNDCVTAWNLCLDKNSMHRSIQSLQFRNLSLTVVEPEAEPTKTPVVPTKAPATPTKAPATPTTVPATPTQIPATPTVTPVTPTETPANPTEAPATPTATATSTTAPTATATATATEPPADDSDNGGSPAILIVAIIEAVVIAGGVVAVIVVKKKKAK